MQTKLIPFFALFIIGISTTVMFQNCGSDVKFSTTVPNTNSGLAIVGKSCVDPSGITRASGDTWTISRNETLAINCVDAQPSAQGYRLDENWLCSDGTSSKTGAATSLVPPNSSCPAPNLAASLAQQVANPFNYDLSVTATTVHDIKYKCTSRATGASAFAGSLAEGTSTTTLANIVEDLNCHIEALYGDDMKLERNVAVTLDCESKGLLKNPGTFRCEEFACKSITPIASNSNGFYDIPARTSAGICYSLKIMNSVVNSDSSLTADSDAEFVSRDHSAGGGYAAQRHPYVLGSAKLGFILRSGGGARSVNLSGSSDSLSPILVDNFLAVGLVKTSIGLSSNAPYRAYGTADSTVDADEKYVKFRDQNLALTSFGAYGTSTIRALNVTTQVSTEENYSLDVRALDCGRVRELSNIYLVFQ